MALQEKLYSVFRLRRGPGPMISALTGGTAQWERVRGSLIDILSCGLFIYNLSPFFHLNHFESSNETHFFRRENINVNKL